MNSGIMEMLAFWMILFSSYLFFSGAKGQGKMFCFINFVYVGGISLSMHFVLLLGLLLLTTGCVRKKLYNLILNI